MDKYTDLIKGISLFGIGLGIGIIIGVNCLIKPFTDNCFTYENEIYCKIDFDESGWHNG